jgi:hypothetical protein
MSQPPRITEQERLRALRRIVTALRRRRLSEAERLHRQLNRRLGVRDPVLPDEVLQKLLNDARKPK